MSIYPREKKKETNKETNHSNLIILRIAIILRFIHI